jgi:GNAT superfamily N-acetyltransferase/RimJ/RimL family protein N-acetyltransferase
VGIDIAPVDKDDDHEVKAFHHVAAVTRAADVPDFPELTVREAVGWLRHPWPTSDQFHFLARLDGAPAGFLVLSLPRTDNTHVVQVDLGVLPDRRRRGVGRAMFDFAVDFARARGRNLLMGDYVTPLPGGPPRDACHAAFAAAMGVSPALPEVRRRLDLDTVDKDAWHELAAEAQARASGYTLLSWVGPAPDDAVADVARLEGRMVTDAPMGELRYEPEKYDTDRIRGNERVLELRGRRHYHAAIRHNATGQLAAWTMIALDADITTQAWQQTTIVDPDHRGHRLGTLVKLENLHHTLAHEPELRHVDTWNAAENKHMIAINEAMGFRAVDGWVDWQHDV